MTFNKIKGLRYEDNNFNINSDFSCLLINENRPLNIVFHGHKEEFKYEYYGIHVGTEDRLTFIGPENQKITGYFIDCRKDSPTWGNKIKTSLIPNLEKVLVIPPGVAHTFDNLENIYTLNSFKFYLPEPNKWISGELEWSISADTINLHRNPKDSEIPKIIENKLPASQVFYEITARNISEKLDGVIYEYPLTKRVDFEDNTTNLLKFRKIETNISEIPSFEEITKINGVGIKRRIFVTGSDDDDNGYTIMNSPNEFILHKSKSKNSKINSDKFDINKVKNITILGNKKKKVKIKIIQNELEQVIYLEPSPLKDLVIPSGVHFEISDIKKHIIVIKSS